MLQNVSTTGLVYYIGKYTDINDLRYGKIMLMCDSDEDGFHIKGLLFNIFYSLWPSLLKHEGFNGF